MGCLLIENFIRIPQAKFKIYNPQNMSGTVVFLGLFLSYMMVTGGIVFDMINEPPSVGTTQDPNGKVRVQTVMANRINAQYIIEGLTAAAFFCVGGAGLVILMQAADEVGMSPTKRKLMILLGAGLTLLSYLVCISFLRIKMPGYLW
eukprot:NODE_630_length_699_cov_12.697552_g621_i0.p1 GENE.NODE_630_length_699_cov_12.697552_g621_i0~~NODE_630_length_699_cov_12.697552_g621_i0.p1  ORF type:complete len:147 (-),score=15.83 NODE_630_length_699_cov_12.697552_g621_i0:186-626(-)